MKTHKHQTMFAINLMIGINLFLFGNFCLAAVPVAEWRFEQSSWNATAGEVDNNVNAAEDGTARNSANTTVATPAKLTDPGTCQYGIFNGTDNTGSYITVPDSNTLDLPTEFSITAWVYLRSFPANGKSYAVVSKGNDYGLWIDQAGKVIVTYTDNRANNKNLTSSNTGKLLLDTWYYLAVGVKDNEQKIYINGVEDRAASARAILSTNTTALTIGGDPTDGTSYFDGYIDEVKIWNVAASNVDVNGSHTSTHSCPLGLNFTPTTPVAEWRLDETLWTGATGEINNQVSTGPDGVSRNSTTTSITLPARSGSPGSCRYGSFNGTDSTGNYLEIPDDNSLDLTSEFSISAWVYLASYPPNGKTYTVVNKGKNYGLEILSTGKVRLVYGRAGNNTTNLDTSSDTLSLNTWYHLIVGYKAGGQYIYINGSLKQTGSDQAAGSQLSANASSLYIGATPTTATSFFDGYIDEVKIWNKGAYDPWVKISNATTHSCPAEPAGIDHFTISHSGTAVTCEAENVLITAKDASGLTVVGYTGTANLTTSTANGDWLNNSTALNSNDSGIASYTFVVGDNGYKTLKLRNSHSGVVNINVAVGAISERSGTALAGDDPTLTFSDSGLRFFVDNSEDSIGTQTAGKASTQNLKVKAVKTNTTTGECEARLPAGDQVIQMAYECENPGSCIANEKMTIAKKDAGGVVRANYTISGNSNDVISAYDNVTLTFDSAATALFGMTHPDVGQIKIHAKKVLAADALGPAMTLAGASNAFVVKPVGLCFKITDAAYLACNSNYASCAKFKKAGEVFALQVSGRAWESNDASVADYCNTQNAIAQNFKLDTITLTNSVVAPTGGISGALSVSSVSVTSAGLANISQTISEVGVFTFTATPPQYFSNTLSAANTANLGRFYPDHFDVSAGDITETCTTGTDFTYLGQQFNINYMLAAKSTTGATTSNYNSTFVKLNTASGITYGAIDSLAPTSLNTRITEGGAPSSWTGNTGTSLITDSLKVIRKISNSKEIVDGPYNSVTLGVLPLDSDGVTLSTSGKNIDTDNSNGFDRASIGSTVLRFGRVYVMNAYGAETSSLDVPFRLEYYDGKQFVLNSDDSYSAGSCSALLRSKINFAGNAITTSGNLNVTVGSGQATATFTKSSVNDLLTATDVLFNGGDSHLKFSAPGNAGKFTITVDLGLYDYLRYDWNENGNAADDTSIPAHEIYFGSRRGNDRVINWSESF